MPGWRQRQIAVAVPVTGASLFVLDTTKGVLDAAPQVGKNTFSVGASADSDSRKVDDYWRANLPAKARP
jgi:hypothetical protein